MRKESKIAIIPYLQTRLQCAVCYVQVENMQPKNRVMPNATVKAYSGKVGINAAKRIKRAVEILALNTTMKTTYSKKQKKQITFWIGFATLTIPSPDVVCHKEAVHALQLLLLQLKRTHDIRYVWKAELQKRGQIHFHLCFDKFIEWRELRERWNNICKKYGWLDTYFACKGHYNANSTDIKSITSAQHISGYIAKYVSKDGGKLNCKVWDCSSELKGKKYYTTEYIAENLNNIEAKAKRIIKLDNCEIVVIDKPIELLSMEQKADYIWNWELP